MAPEALFSSRPLSSAHLSLLSRYRGVSPSIVLQPTLRATGPGVSNVLEVLPRQELIPEGAIEWAGGLGPSLPDFNARGDRKSFAKAWKR